MKKAQYFLRARTASPNGDRERAFAATGTQFVAAEAEKEGG